MNRRAKYSPKYNSLVVCALAYAIAIQSALLGYVAATRTATAEELFGQVCAPQNRDDAPVAPSHGVDMLCCLAAGCSSSAATPVERAALATPERRIVASVAKIVPVDRFVGWPSERPHSSRAPPA
jgi:hypothetical protein